MAATAIAFANAWPNAVALDDKYFVNNELLPDWTEPSELLRGDVWRTAGAQTGLYRPALLLSLSLDSKLFGGWLAGYHLSNIFLHLVVTLLVYGFLRQLLQQAPNPPKRPDLYALLAALVFAVHPVHTEVVDSVFNRSDMLVSLGAVAGLWWLLHFLETRPARAWAGLGMAYLFALLCKENAAVIPGLALALILFLPADSWRRRIRRGIPVLSMLLPLGIYFYMRAHGLSSGAGAAGSGEGVEPVASMFDSLHFMKAEDLLTLLGKWGIALRLMLWPHPLQLNYPSPPGALSAVLAALQALLLVIGILQLRKGRGVLLTGLAWFYLALLPASRLVNTSDAIPHLAERYLYLPSVGMSILLAFGLAWLGSRLGRSRAVLLTLLAVLVMIPLTWLRNHEWGSDLRLFETEYRRSGSYPDTLRFLTGAQLRVGNFSRGAEICDRHPDKVVQNARVARHCGMIYTRLERYEDAERIYLQATAQKANAAVSNQLALLYLEQGRWKDAAVQFHRAVAQADQPAEKAMLQGLMLAHLYPREPERLEQARQFFEQAYALQPLMTSAKGWALRMSKAIEILQSAAPGEADAQNDSRERPTSRL